MAPPTGLMVYSEYFDPYVGITSVNVVDSNTADLYLNQVGINTSTISNASFTLGHVECVECTSILLTG